jgi:hypothetical protein
MEPTPQYITIAGVSLDAVCRYQETGAGNHEFFITIWIRGSEEILYRNNMIYADKDCGQRWLDRTIKSVEKKLKKRPVTRW